MARKILQDTAYTFTPSTRTIVLPNSTVRKERLVLITNVTTGVVIYNFSDPALLGTVTVTNNGANNSTTIVLAYDTTAMASNHQLQIVIDEYEEKFTPSEVMTDPVNKFRTSTPQALIDTDFEYGTQLTKWESVALVNNKPAVVASAAPLATVSAMAMTIGQRIVTVSLTNTSGIIPGSTTITVTDSVLPYANGTFVVDAVTPGVSFTYTAKQPNNSTISAIWDSSKTVIALNTNYTNATIGASPVFTVSGSDLKVTVTTTVNHGLSIGNEIEVTGVSGTNAPNGSFVVATVLSPTQFVYYANPTVGNPASLTATLATATTATGSANSTTITVAAATNLGIGQAVIGAGILPGTVVTNLVSTTVTLSNPTTAALSSTAVTFTGIATTATQSIVGATNVVVASGAGITAGMSVVGTGIAPGTTVINVNGTTINLSIGTTAALSTTPLSFNAGLYARPQATFQHRAFDGGVLFSTNSSSNNVAAIRQTRRYFRYQSGKGIQISSGTILRPYASVDTITDA